ncbi:cytochrome c [Usitatibacter palustris]|uniref:Cytochrome c domain-containing protein n=1 Tax=Usitatibacter palustris TaxID=2732487 RepID=A0A6M4H4H9_9PROT|nr:cytochrome c [Usitatibacter palustris]QJR14182.1 hypothetical protein DSM104440_00975 [Usitatibacter palustris]
MHRQPNPRHVWLAIALAIAGMILLFATRTASAAEPLRGQALYESRCTSCHEKSVHGRVKREAKDFNAVRAWVERWNASLALRWDGEEVDDVAAFLNNTYYRYPCPPTICKVVSLR